MGTLVMQHDAGENVLLNSMRHPQDTQPDSAVLLMTLGKLWLSGVAIDWHGVHEHEERYRIPLPTYPFERKRCWIERPLQLTNSQPPETGKKNDIADWFYIPSWKRSPLPPQPGAGLRIASPCLVFINEADIGSRLIHRLKQECKDVIFVRAGDRFSEITSREYTFNFTHYEEYDKLLNSLIASGRTPATILCLQSLTDKETDTERNHGDLHYMYNMLALAQSIGKQNITTNIRIMVVSNGMQDIAGEGIRFPEKAAMLGPVKIIPLEYPNIRCRYIDVEIPEHGIQDEHRLIEQLIREIAAESDEPVVALRGMYRWIQTASRSGWKPGKIRKQDLGKTAFI